MPNEIPRLVYREQKGLWKHMATQCAVPLVSREQYRERESNLKAIITRVNDGGYSPGKPHGFLSTPKQNSVARFVPVINHADTAVYFTCLQCVDRKLAAAAVPQTFGGWSIGGARREIEERQALELFGGEDSLSIPTSCYNRAAWVENWSQFWKLLAAQHEHADESAWFAMFDIANFYDSIDLHRLENSVRSESAGVQFAMNVLFHLLRTWNKGICLYSQSTKGLPMDVVGDCSRLLANFYLTAFDAQFREEVTGKGGDYMRFADDMVVRGSSEKACHEFIYRASEGLHQLGLNINVAKVRYVPKDQFNQYWGFVIMDRFESGDTLNGLALLKGFVDNDRFGRKPTALKRAISLVSKTDHSDADRWKDWVREAALQESVPLQLSREQLLSFVRLYRSPTAALDQLVPVFMDQPFTQPKAIFLRALQALSTIAPETRDVRVTVVGRIRELNDPVLDICAGASAA